MMVCAVWIAFSLTSIGKAWLFVWAMGAGIGPVLILRWFWWRVNASSEISALATSVILALGFEALAALQHGTEYRLFASAPRIGDLVLQTHHKALILVPVTMLVWITVTFLTRPVTLDRLVAFYKRVRPGGIWTPVAQSYPSIRCNGLSWRRAGIWVAAWAGVYGLIFGLGYLVLGHYLHSLPLLAVALVGGGLVWRELHRTVPVTGQVEPPAG